MTSYLGDVNQATSPTSPSPSHLSVGSLAGLPNAVLGKCPGGHCRHRSQLDTALPVRPSGSSEAVSTIQGGVRWSKQQTWTQSKDQLKCFRLCVKEGLLAEVTDEPRLKGQV